MCVCVCVCVCVCECACVCQTFNSNFSAAFRRYLAEAAKTFELKDSLASVNKLVISNVSLARQMITGFLRQTSLPHLYWCLSKLGDRSRIDGNQWFGVKSSDYLPINLASTVAYCE